MPESLGTLALLVGGSVLGDARFVVRDVTHDSRSVRPGTLFVAVEGERFDGHGFVDGLDSGAAVCVRRLLPTSLPQLIVADPRAAMGTLADAVHGRPSEAMQVIGITGTNGKTSVSYLLSSILDVDGRTSACVGTTGVIIGDETRPLPRTTPEASDLHRLLASLRGEGVDTVALEVSSHALALHRVTGVRFAAVGFTNLSHDHLDFHADMEEYFATKARLFERSEERVINAGDRFGARLAEQYPAATWLGRDIRAVDVVQEIDRTGFELRIGDAAGPVTIPIGGRFTVENAMMAAGLAHRVGVGFEAIVEGLVRARPVPGRFQPVRAGQPFGVVVDYAHTPEGIVGAIASARALTSGRVIAVIGAGGDRDHAKRAPMGRAASAADVVVLTSDNPRSEDPRAIMDDVERGVDVSATRLRVVADRASALRDALSLASAGDTVLILGKGHETTQEIDGRFVPFDDRAVARSILEELYP